MTKMVGSYSIKNLIQSTEYLLNLSKSLNDEIRSLEKTREEVTTQQKEAARQGLLVKKMTSYMSEELERMEENSSKNTEISKNLEKLTNTENRLRDLQGRLTEFIEGDDESLKNADSTLSIELKQYESFLLTLTTSLNEKISNLEKIADRIKAEKRESEQQKLLLKEMVDLFNGEIEDLEQTLKEIKE